MKILVIGHSIAHYRQRKMWEWIAEQGHKVVAFCLPSYADEVYEPVVKGSYELVLAPPIGTEEFWHWPQIPQIIKDVDPDIIMCYQEPFSYVAWHVMKNAKLFNKPFVLFTWENIRKAFPQPTRQMESDVLKEANLVIAGNSDAGRICLEKGAKRVEVCLQTGLDTNLFIPYPKLQITDKVEPKKLLFVGRMVPEKGIELILKAFDKLPENFVLKFVGGRGSMDELVKQHKEFGKRITLEPWVDHTKLPDFYNWADMTLVPSMDTKMWVEQCGYVIGESLLCDTPVLSSYSKSIVELWNTPDVHFIQQGDVDALVLILKTESSYEIKDGRKYVKDNYSIEEIGQLYIDILEDVTWPNRKIKKE